VQQGLHDRLREELHQQHHGAAGPVLPVHELHEQLHLGLHEGLHLELCQQLHQLVHEVVHERLLHQLHEADRQVRRAGGAGRLRTA
jgi:hypothetical protein